MKKEGCFINSIVSVKHKTTVSIKHKILSCVLAFFVLISSMNLLNFEGHKKTIMKSVELSTEIVLNQFFYISALPVGAITKLFAGTDKNKKESEAIQLSKETTTIAQQQTAESKTLSTATATATAETEKATATANETKNNKGTDTKDNNAMKASIGYSIIAGISGISKVIKGEAIKDLFIADKLLETNFIRYADSINVVLSEKIINVMFVMMLLLAILLARRNVGDNNIINNNINNKNNKITRFI